jgi:hypothetical protein
MTNIETTTELAIVTGLLELLECACAEVTVNGQGEPCFCGIYPGSNVSWDYCGECNRGKCGMVYLQPGRTFPYTVFPQQELDAKCSLPLGFEIELGVVRCMPTISEDGDLPDPADITAAALGLIADQYALYSAIKCCETSLQSLVIERWTPSGPQGGCVAGAWTLYAAI